jgi:hypothetical protein
MKFISKDREFEVTAFGNCWWTKGSVLHRSKGRPAFIRQNGEKQWYENNHLLKHLFEGNIYYE